jgi:predicted amidophosphoribosyltransferase
MTQFWEQRLTTLITLDRCGMLPEMDRLLEKYFEENLGFYQGFTVAPVPLHFNKMKEHGFDQTFLIVRQVARALKLPFEGDCFEESRRLPNSDHDSNRKIL